MSTTLPEILLPYGMPIFQAMNHAITLRSKHAVVKFRTGHSRTTPIATSRPRVVTVGLFLTAAQMAAFDNWYEDDLDVGKRQFSARVANQGTGLLWWCAEWLDRPLETPLAGGHWRVTGSLLLTGTGSATGPANTSAAVEFAGTLLVTAAATLDGNGAVEFAASLETVALGAVEFGAALLDHPPFYVLREDLSFVLRQDGGKILRE